MLARDHAFPNVLVTVNDVDITPDLKHAYFFVGVIGPEHEARDVVETLNRQRGELQARVSKRVILKNTPHFHFRLDHSVERGVRITGIMETIDRQLAESAARDAAAGVSALGAPDPDETGEPDEATAPQAWKRPPHRGIRGEEADDEH
jgi:ribosome-binding factor A